MANRYVHDYGSGDTPTPTPTAGYSLKEIDATLTFQAPLNEIDIELASTLADVKSILTENQKVQVSRIYVDTIGMLTPTESVVFDKQSMIPVSDYTMVEYSDNQFIGFSLTDLKGVELSMSDSTPTDETFSILNDSTLTNVVVYYNLYEK